MKFFAALVLILFSGIAFAACDAEFTTARVLPAQDSLKLLAAHLQTAGILARRGQLDDAIQVLEEYSIPSDVNVLPRESMPNVADEVRDERAYQAAVAKGLRRATLVGGVNDQIHFGLPLPPGRDEASDLKRRAWLRIATEEFAHLYQFLLLRQNKSVTFLAQIARDPAVVNAILLNAKGLAERGEGTTTSNALEADRYAFQIETLGLDLMPVWMGEDGDAISEVVDQYLTHRGVPNRVWRRP